MTGHTFFHRLTAKVIDGELAPAKAVNGKNVLTSLDDRKSNASLKKDGTEPIINTEITNSDRATSLNSSLSKQDG